MLPLMKTLFQLKTILKKSKMVRFSLVMKNLESPEGESSQGFLSAQNSKLN